MTVSAISVIYLFQFSMCLLCLLQMIKQSKINSFLQLISKAHSQQKRQRKQSPFRKSKVLTQQSSNKTIFDNEVSFIYHNHHELENMGLQYTQSNFKDTFRERLTHLFDKMKNQKREDKQSVYDAYRQSLEKKHSFYKNTRNSYNLGYDKEVLNPKHRFSFKNAKQISFPINRPHKSVFYQNGNVKITKIKNFISQSPINESKCSSPKRIRTQGVLQPPIGPKNSLKKMLQRQQFQYLRPEPMNCEPMFKIQKCPAIRYQEELLKKPYPKKQHQQHIKIKCKLPSRQLIKDIKESLSDKKEMRTYTNQKKSQRYVKKFQRLINMDKVTPWESSQKDMPEIFEYD